MSHIILQNSMKLCFNSSNEFDNKQAYASCSLYVHVFDCFKRRIKYINVHL